MFRWTKTTAYIKKVKIKSWVSWLVFWNQNCLENFKIPHAHKSYSWSVNNSMALLHVKNPNCDVIFRYIAGLGPPQSFRLSNPVVLIVIDCLFSSSSLITTTQGYSIVLYPCHYSFSHLRAASKRCLEQIVVEYLMPYYLRMKSVYL